MLRRQAAQTTVNILEELKKKLSDAPPELHVTFQGTPDLMSFKVEAEDVQKILKTFPVGSSGGPGGLTLQHLLSMIAGVQR